MKNAFTNELALEYFKKKLEEAAKEISQFGVIDTHCPGGKIVLPYKIYALGITATGKITRIFGHGYFSLNEIVKVGDHWYVQQDSFGTWEPADSIGSYNASNIMELHRLVDWHNQVVTSDVAVIDRSRNAIIAAIQINDDKPNKF